MKNIVKSYLNSCVPRFQMAAASGDKPASQLPRLARPGPLVTSHGVPARCPARRGAGPVAVRVPPMALRCQGVPQSGPDPLAVVPRRFK